MCYSDCNFYISAVFSIMIDIFFENSPQNPQYNTTLVFFFFHSKISHYYYYSVLQLVVLACKKVLDLQFTTSNFFFRRPRIAYCIVVHTGNKIVRGRQGTKPTAEPSHTFKSVSSFISADIQDSESEYFFSFCTML